MWHLSVLFADSIGLNTEAPRYVAPVCIVYVVPCAARLGSRHQPYLRLCWRARGEKPALAPGLDCVWRARGEKLALAAGPSSHAMSRLNRIFWRRRLWHGSCLSTEAPRYVVPVCTLCRLHWFEYGGAQARGTCLYCLRRPVCGSPRAPSVAAYACAHTCCPEGCISVPRLRAGDAVAHVYMHVHTRARALFTRLWSTSAPRPASRGGH